MSEEAGGPLDPPEEPEGEADDYWARLARGRSPGSAPLPSRAMTAPPTSAGIPAAPGLRPPAAPPPRMPPPMVPAPTSYSAPGGYKPPNTKRNWLIGAGAAVVLIVVAVVVALVSTSGVQNTLRSLTALPSSGGNTVAWYWGSDPFADSNAATALNVDTSENFTTVVASRQAQSFAYFVGLDRRGTAYVWGTPSLRNAPLNVTTQPTAVKMPPGVRFTSISTNQAYVLALDQAGRLWEWGDLSRDKPSTSNGPATTSQSPVAVSTPAGVTFRQISAGWEFSLALDSTGHAWSWGNSVSYDLGLPTNQTPIVTPTPVTMPAGVTFTAVSAGLSHSVALDSSSRAWAWGDNEYGELGVSASAVPAGAPCAQSAVCSATPLLVNTPANVRLTAIAAGEDYTAAVDSSGRVWAWGTNDHGALGLPGTATTCAAPTSCALNGPAQPTGSVPAVVPTPAAVHFVAVSVTQGNQSGEDATIALDSHGGAWAWGANLVLQYPAGTQPCFTAENQVQSSATGVELCMLKPSPLDTPAGVTFKGVTAATDFLLGLPR